MKKIYNLSRFQRGNFYVFYNSQDPSLTLREYKIFIENVVC
jgi:hypothetical protein